VILQVYVDEATLARLQAFSRETGRALEELAESAVANEASKVRNVDSAAERRIPAADAGAEAVPPLRSGTERTQPYAGPDYGVHCDEFPLAPQRRER
jgi:hypothetical protein